MDAMNVIHMTQMPVMTYYMRFMRALEVMTFTTHMH